MDTWMPYLQLPFLSSDVGQVLFLFWALILVGCHMQYVHSPVDISRTFTNLELVGDLIGLTWMRNLCAHFYPESQALQVFLFVHFVVHLLSLAWGVLHWPSLDKHMREFRRRQGPALFVKLEWAYEQSDTALYFVLAMKVLTSLPPGVAMALVMTTSVLFATTGLKRWFGKPTAAGPA